MLKTKIILIVALATSMVTVAQKKWTLKECVDYALENNITVNTNTLNVEVAEKNVKANKANFLPSLDASTSGNLNFGSTFNPVSNDRISTTIFGGCGFEASTTGACCG